MVLDSHPRATRRQIADDAVDRGDAVVENDLATKQHAVAAIAAPVLGAFLGVFGIHCRGCRSRGRAFRLGIGDCRHSLACVNRNCLRLSRQMKSAGVGLGDMQGLLGGAEQLVAGLAVEWEDGAADRG